MSTPESAKPKKETKPKSNPRSVLRRWFIILFLACFTVFGIVGGGLYLYQIYMNYEPCPDFFEALPRQEILYGKTNSSGVHGIYRLNLRTCKRIQISSETVPPASFTPQIIQNGTTISRPSPDTQWVADSYEKDAGFNPKGLTIRNALTQQVTFQVDESISNFAWSPDSRWFAFVTYRENMGPRYLYVIEAQTGIAHPQMSGRELPTTSWSVDTVFSPDGTRFAFTQDNRLHILTLDSGTNVTSGQILYLRSVSWSSDNQWLTFVGETSLYLARADGAALYKLGNYAEFYYWSSWDKTES